MVRAVNAGKFAADVHCGKCWRLRRLAASSSGQLRVHIARRNLAKLERESTALQERYATRSQAFQSIAQTHSAAMAWITYGRPAGTTLADFAGAEPELKKGEDIAIAIERLRRRGRELKADLHRIASAPSTHRRTPRRACVSRSRRLRRPVHRRCRC